MLNKIVSEMASNIITNENSMYAKELGVFLHPSSSIKKIYYRWAACTLRKFGTVPPSTRKSIPVM